MIYRDRLLQMATALRAHDRIAVAGGPLSGKSLITDTLMEWPFIRTDDYKHLAWDQQVLAVTLACKPLPRFILSGVRTGSVLLAGLEVDIAAWLDTPIHRLSRPQETMRKGCKSIFLTWARQTRCHIIFSNRH